MVRPTVMVAGVAPDTPDTITSQLVLLATEAVNTVPTLAALKAKLWVAGCAPPLAYKNVKLAGVAVNWAGGGAEVPTMIVED